jgi:hypothetical protein
LAGRCRPGACYCRRVSDDLVLDPMQVRARIAMLSGRVVTPLWIVCRRMRNALAFTAGFAFAIAILSHDPRITAVVGLVVAASSMSYAWWPLTNSSFRHATEVYYDHARREQARWVALTGGPMPRRPAEQEAWLIAHPSSPGRSGILFALGRLQEADAVLATVQPASPDERFERDLDLQIHRLAGGQAVEIAPLRAAWAAIPPSAERDLRRECLGFFDAMVAGDQHRDPVSSLAAAWPEVAKVERSNRTPWLLARWSVLPAVIVIGAAALAAVVPT